MSVEIFSILRKACTPAGKNIIHVPANWPLNLLVLGLNFEMLFHIIRHVVSLAISDFFQDCHNRVKRTHCTTGPGQHDVVKGGVDAELV